MEVAQDGFSKTHKPHSPPPPQTLQTRNMAVKKGTFFLKLCCLVHFLDALLPLKNINKCLKNLLTSCINYVSGFHSCTLCCGHGCHSTSICSFDSLSSLYRISHWHHLRGPALSIDVPRRVPWKKENGPGTFWGYFEF